MSLQKSEAQASFLHVHDCCSPCGRIANLTNMIWLHKSPSLSSKLIAFTQFGTHAACTCAAQAVAQAQRPEAAAAHPQGNPRGAPASAPHAAAASSHALLAAQLGQQPAAWPASLQQQLQHQYVRQMQHLQQHESSAQLPASLPNAMHSALQQPSSYLGSMLPGGLSSMQAQANLSAILQQRSGLLSQRGPIYPGFTGPTPPLSGVGGFPPPLPGFPPGGVGHPPGSSVPALTSPSLVPPRSVPQLGAIMPAGAQQDSAMAQPSFMAATHQGLNAAGQVQLPNGQAAIGNNSAAKPQDGANQPNDTQQAKTGPADSAGLPSSNGAASQP